MYPRRNAGWPAWRRSHQHSLLGGDVFFLDLAWTVQPLVLGWGLLATVGLAVVVGFLSTFKILGEPPPAVFKAGIGKLRLKQVKRDFIKIISVIRFMICL